MLVGYSKNTKLIDSAVVKRAVSQMLPNFADDSADDFLQEAGFQEELDDGRRI